MADRQRNTISLKPNELYSNVLLQTLSDSDNEEKQVGDKADEIYSRPTEETYPMITSALLPTLPTWRNPAINAYYLPPAASPTTLPRHTRETMAQHNQNVQIKQPVHNTTEQTVNRATETPTITKNVLSSPAAGVKLPNTGLEASRYAQPPHIPLRNEQITNNLKAKGGDKPISPQAVQSDTIVPAVHTAYELREPNRTQTKAVEGRLTKAYRQPHSEYRIIRLSSILMPITQRINLQRKYKYMKSGSRIIGEGIREIQSSSIFHTAAADEPIGQAVPIFRPLALSEQPAALEPKSILQAYPTLSGSDISKGALDRPSPSKAPMITRYPIEMASSTWLHKKLTDRVGAEMLPDTISRQSVQKTRQTQGQKPLVTSRVELQGNIPDSIYQTERVVGDNQGKASYYPSITKYGRIGLSLTRGKIINPLFSSQPASVAGLTTQLSPEYESIHHAVNLATRRFTKAMHRNGLFNKTENYGLVPSRVYMSVLPDKKYAYQQAPELALTSSSQEKAGSNTVYRKEVLAGTSDIFHELTYSAKQNVPDLAPAPINQMPDIQTQPAESEPQEAGSNEKVKKEDLENIARDVYHILKRRLNRERERALGVI